MKKVKYCIDISTLFECHYTGISNVNYQVVKYFYTLNNANSIFFHNNNIIKKEYIKQILYKKEGGDWILSLHHSQKLYDGELSINKNEISVGIFSNVKTLRNKFDYEVQILYDLTFLLLSETHHHDTVKHHGNSIVKDIKTNNLNVCISESTLDDFNIYLGLDRSKSIVSYLACEHDLLKDNLYSNLLGNFNIEKFILILGTIEPRKNIKIVFDFINKNKDILDEYKFVFLGKNGWNVSFEDYINTLDINKDIVNSRIKHFGYVSDEERNILLMSAQFVIYPSIYEGFGLPVLESLSVGTPILTTYSSSIPEVGGKHCIYFDPFELEEFEKKFYEMKISRENINKNELIDYSKNFQWSSFMDKILKRINNDL